MVPMHIGAIVFSKVVHLQKTGVSTLFKSPSGGTAVSPPVVLCSLSEIIIDVILSSCFYVRSVLEELVLVLGSV